ncbi:MAG TPA: hypothetical protein VMS56_11120 [Thermoanaerobaculia bacterium]|nr:hypothetical protein [Thermoanaerobaculia bacterium]
MNGEDVPRRLPERTGRHHCVSCLAETPAEEYFRNDHVCEACNSGSGYPLASTPDAEAPEPKVKAGGK